MNKRLTAEGSGKGLLEGGCIIELGSGMKRRRGGVPNEGMGVVQRRPACLFVYACVSIPPYLYLIVSVFCLFRETVNVCACMSK